MLATTRRTNTNNANHATKRTKTKIPEPTWSVQGLHLASNQHSHNNDNEEQDDEYYEVLAMRSGLPPSCVSQTKHSSNNNRTNVAQMMQFLSMLQKRQQQQQQDSIPNHDDDDDESIMERGSLRLRTTPQQDSSTRRFTDTHDPDDEAAVDPEWKSVWNAVLQSNKLVRHPTTEENIGSGEEEETLDYFSVPKTHDPN
eukprot:CAMPEP_0198295898 /NCGR_PEP_ID=MMETSP1449-20131203/30184_1 /TAXON_ID=420275 /ORGANISM="Attheya septentrionalis, Strain CCMP2084" /LENGTH=197 /DNA_ID=CAMNT_0043996333 /DNA_START=108 /DNA_END=701 /DNA_ORIENTATION=-